MFIEFPTELREATMSPAKHVSLYFDDEAIRVHLSAWWKKRHDPEMPDSELAFEFEDGIWEKCFEDVLGGNSEKPDLFEQSCVNWLEGQTPQIVRDLYRYLYISGREADAEQELRDRRKSGSCCNPRLSRLRGLPESDCQIVGCDPPACIMATGALRIGPVYRWSYELPPGTRREIAMAQMEGFPGTIEDFIPMIEAQTQGM
jgi:hypothetical protein